MLFQKDVKRIFSKTLIGCSSILQCARTKNKTPYPCHCADLHIFTLYAVKEIEKAKVYSS